MVRRVVATHVGEGSNPSGSSSPRVLNKRLDGVPEGAVYIGRGSKWGNPFRIGRDGDRAEVIAEYALWLTAQEHLWRALDELRGRDLVCYCAPAMCHGDILLALANAGGGGMEG